MFPIITLIALTFFKQIYSFPIDNIVRYTPYSTESNRLATKANQTVSKFNQKSYDTAIYPGLIIDFKLNNITSSSLFFSGNLSMVKSYSIIENNTICYNASIPSFGTIKFNLDWAYVTVLKITYNGKATLELKFNDFTSCVTYSANANGAFLRQYSVKTILNRDNFTVNSSDFASSNAITYISDMLKNGLLDNLTKQIDTTFNEDFNKQERLSSNYYQVTRKFELIKFNTFLLYNKTVGRLDFTSSPSGFLTIFDLKFLDVKSIKPLNDYDTIISADSSTVNIMNTNFLVWATNIISEKGVSRMITPNESSYTIEDLGAVMLNIFSKYNYSEIVSYSIKVNDYSSFIMRNNGFDGSSNLKVVLFAAGTNETLLSCEFQVDFLGFLGFNREQGSVVLNIRDISIVNINKVVVDENLYTVDYKQLKGFLRSMLNSSTRKEFAQFQVLDDDHSGITNMSLDIPYGIIFK